MLPIEYNDKVRHKPGCSPTVDGYRLTISDLLRKGDCSGSENKGIDRLPLLRKGAAPLFSHTQKSRFPHHEAHTMLGSIPSPRRFNSLIWTA